MSPLSNQAHASQISIDPDLWHKRLGHPSPACLQLASSLLPISICPKAKQTRLPFPLSTIKSHSPFNLLHCDIWGPHKTPTHLRLSYSFQSLWCFSLADLIVGLQTAARAPLCSLLSGTHRRSKTKVR